MEYILNPILNKEFRLAYNGSHFASMKVAEFQNPSNKKKYKADAANCVCACMDRIDLLVIHFNKLFAEVDSPFKLCDILNYGQTLIDCIDMLAKIYEVPYKEKSDSSCFNEIGIDGNGTDEKYFKYIRSLCSVHPVETSRHQSYQGIESEWSPWIDVLVGTNHEVLHKIMAKDKNKVEKADYAIVVYRNDMELSKYIYVSLDEIFMYIRKRYCFLKEIKSAIEKKDIELANQLKGENISLPESFENYDLYLDYFVGEIYRRGMGDFRFELNEWKTILHSYFEDQVLDKYLVDYKNTIMKNIEKLHNGVQKMDFDFVTNFDIVGDSTSGIPSDYAYSCSKLVYLLPEWEDEDFLVADVTENHFYMGDKERLISMIDEVEVFKKEGINIAYANRLIDDNYNTNNSEWARVQVKWIEQFYKYPIDYQLSDWYVYLQLRILPQN
ncbi:hypothetical protein [Butyrivibrio sp. M55]|uniref:hypothetical protein n=1 Tax=Butyrivibrio sp. M55 TaxID=1855323 RepID=UPI00111401DC|nr:hypothetical protein [Butyrivibrio sp. M55]